MKYSLIYVKLKFRNRFNNNYSISKLLIYNIMVLDWLIVLIFSIKLKKFSYFY